MITAAGALNSIGQRIHNRSVELLHGIVAGIIADKQINDAEIQFLKSWLAEHPDVANEWPGSAIAMAIRTAMADGIITDQERTHLLTTLQSMAVTDFANTGSASAEVMQLPINDAVAVDLQDSTICLTGVFLFGTRAKCEELTQAAGAATVGTITRSVDYLVIGTNVSPAWRHTSYGRKIEQAVELKAKAHPIDIISERRWLEALNKTCT